MIEKSLTLSIGVGALKSSDSQDGLIQKVDKALYRAKEQGKDSIVTAWLKLKLWEDSFDGINT